MTDASEAMGAEAAVVQRAAASRAGATPMQRFAEAIRTPGALAAIPMGLVLLLGFVGPLILVFVFAFMPPQTFSILQPPTLQNFTDIVSDSYYISFVASVSLAAATVVILTVVCYPLAYAMTRVFGRHATWLTVALGAPLFVADNLRLMGWVLFLVKGGVLSGTLESLFGIEVDSLLYTTSATLFGLVYTYLPFMLFPIILGISMVPTQVREAAFDLGASRFQVLKEVDLPLAMPGILIGGLITFILAAGSLSEAKILGGTAVVMVAQDIQKEFTFAQNWPKGSALSVLLILVAGGLSLALFRRIDLDAIFGRK